VCVGVDRILLKDHHLLPTTDYHHLLVSKLFGILETSTKSDNKVRLVTMAMCMKLLQQVLDFSKEVILIDEHLALLEVYLIYKLEPTIQDTSHYIHYTHTQTTHCARACTHTTRT